jgi:hypothetical protein
MSTGANSPYDDINRQVNALRVRSETSLPPSSPKRALDNSDDRVASEAKKGRQQEATFTPNTADQAIAGSSNSNKADPKNSEGQKTREKNVPPHLEKAFKTCRGIFEKNARFQAHLDFLNKYLEEDRIPKGLSINIRPSFGAKDDTFVQQWNHKLTSASKELLTLTITRLEGEVQELLVKGTTAKNILYDLAESKEEGDKVLAFIKTLVDKRLTTLTKIKQNKFDADRKGTKRPKQAKWRQKQGGGKMSLQRQFMLFQKFMKMKS